MNVYLIHQTHFALHKILISMKRNNLITCTFLSFRWWRNLGLTENLSFARDRLAESFMCSVGLAFEPEYTCLRKWLTKVVILILIIDDVYDVYGTLEELKHFTNAVNRLALQNITAENFQYKIGLNILLVLNFCAGFILVLTQFFVLLWSLLIKCLWIT